MSTSARGGKPHGCAYAKHWRHRNAKHWRHRNAKHWRHRNAKHWRHRNAKHWRHRNAKQWRHGDVKPWQPALGSGYHATRGLYHYSCDCLPFRGFVNCSSHGHDYDVKLQLVESISNAAANAASTAQEIGSGEIVHEATSPKSAAALIQQRSDQTQQDWQQESELVQLQIDTYFPGPAQKKLGKAWTNAEVMVDDLILISGQVDNQPERTQYVNELRDKLAQQGFKLTNQQWTVLNQSPGCYVSDPGCSVAFHEAFKTACLKLAEDIQTYILHSLTANIQDTDTIFQPFICTHTPACNL
jgi:hypothetical protein